MLNKSKTTNKVVKRPIIQVNWMSQP